jgi:LAO/AO transport system kinase
MTLSIDEIASSVRSGDHFAVARAISIIEKQNSESSELIDILTSSLHSLTIGITGSPGAGKSTLTESLINHYREKNLKVGVVAVDPSSPLTGGALLGDRLRMRGHGGDRNVFIRSMSARGNLGGISASTSQTISIFVAAGCDVILLETVGVGQSELEVADLADVVVLLIAPGMGDEVQASKAGIIEVSDIIAVNKSDLPGVDRVVADFQRIIGLSMKNDESVWTQRVVRISASNDQIDDLIKAIDDHEEWQLKNNKRVNRIKQQIANQLKNSVLADVRRSLNSLASETLLQDLAIEIENGTSSYSHAVNELKRLVKESNSLN